MNNFYPPNYNAPEPGWYGYNHPTGPALAFYSRQIRKISRIICFCMLLIYAFSLLSSMLVNAVRFAVEPWHTPFAWVELIDQISECTVYISSFVFPCIILILLSHIPLRSAFPLELPKASVVIPATFVCLGATLAGTFVSGNLSMLIEEVFGLTPFMPDMSLPVTIPAMFVYVMSVCVMPAILEELFFRGAIMQSLRPFGDGFALVCSSILFSMAHGNLVQGPNTLITGLAIGYFVLRTNSLVTGAIIHFVNNSVSVLLELIMQNTTAQQDQFIIMGIYIIYGFGALIGFLYLHLRYGRVFFLVPGNYPLPDGKKYGLFFTSFVAVIFIIVTIITTLGYLH